MIGLRGGAKVSGPPSTMYVVKQGHRGAKGPGRLNGTAARKRDGHRKEARALREARGSHC